MAKKYKITTVHKYQESFRHRKFRKEENTIKRIKSQNWCPGPVGQIGWWKMQIEAKRTFPPRAQNATNCLHPIWENKTSFGNSSPFSILGSCHFSNEYKKHSILENRTGVKVGILLSGSGLFTTFPVLFMNI